MAKRIWKVLLPVLALCAGRIDAQPAAGHGPYFPADSPWYQDISTAPVDPESAAVIGWLASVGGWGGGQMQIDFTIEVLEADASAPFQSFTPTGDFYNPDCDLAPVPLPAGGALEGEDGYECASNGDCHLIVVHRPTNRLYEMWRANVENIENGTFYGGCLAVWDLITYPSAGRGEQCTSADAAGFPIAPLLFNADEVAAGQIDHAIRFILPNSRMRHRVYVHPATHSTSATSGPATAPPYGARLRLRADYPLHTLPNEAARVVARAMQKYGILLADGGTIALTAQSDRFTTAKWDDLLGPHDLNDLQVTDFQMVAGGPRFYWTGDCERTTPLFYDGFELGGWSKWSGRTP
jgi:serine/threonine-protein kinase